MSVNCDQRETPAYGDVGKLLALHYLYIIPHSDDAKHCLKLLTIAFYSSRATEVLLSTRVWEGELE